MWKVSIKNEKKLIPKLPRLIREILVELIAELEKEGPFQMEWHNYSPLSKDHFHCHLNRRWVACWKSLGLQEYKDDKGKILKANWIEVYYVGSRENAPY